MRQEAESLITGWRLMYNLSPLDKRFLDATDEVIIQDLLVRRHHREHIERLVNPEQAAYEDLLAQPDAAERMKNRKDRFLSDPGVRAALQKLGLSLPESGAPQRGKMPPKAPKKLKRRERRATTP